MISFYSIKLQQHTKTSPTIKLCTSLNSVPLTALDMQSLKASTKARVYLKDAENKKQQTKD